MYLRNSMKNTYQLLFYIGKNITISLLFDYSNIYFCITKFSYILK